jgi:hypothetical protein
VERKESGGGGRRCAQGAWVLRMQYYLQAPRNQQRPWKAFPPDVLNGSESACDRVVSGVFDV